MMNIAFFFRKRNSSLSGICAFIRMSTEKFNFFHAILQFSGRLSFRSAFGNKIHFGCNFSSDDFSIFTLIVRTDRMKCSFINGRNIK